MSDFRYIEPRTNPEYRYDKVIEDINYNFGLISGGSLNGAYLPLSGGTVTGATTFSGDNVSPILTIQNPGFFPFAQDSLQVFDGAGQKQLSIDSSNQFAFYAGINGPLYFGTFANPTAGLGGFSSPNQVINCYSVNTTRMGVGGSGSYFAILDPQSLLELRGKADEVQLIIQANDTQTLNILEGRDWSENPILKIDKDWMLIGPAISVTASTAITQTINTSQFLKGYSYNNITSGQSNSFEIINWDLTNNFDYTITGDTTFSFSNNKNGQTIVVAVSNNSSTSGFTTTFTAGTTDIKWKDSISPVQTATTGKTDIYTFVQSNGIIYGIYFQNF